VVGDEGGHHPHFSLGKVDHIGRLIDDCDGNAKESITGTDGETFN